MKTTQPSALRRPCATLLRILAAWAVLVGGVPHAGAAGVDFVYVGDAGNAADTTGYGAVGYAYEIGKFEVTIGQYTDFLNAVAKTDPNGLFNASMQTDLNVAGITRSGVSGSYTYTVINNGGISTNRPIAYVSWFNAARLANWMCNGQPTGSQGTNTTENGAYNLSTAVSGTAPSKNLVNPNTGSTPIYFIPNENEWYKAAYYKGGSTNAGYWTYATQSNTAPGNDIGNGTNQANWYDGDYSVTHSANYSSTQNYLTDVGAFTASGSPYGTFDQTGGMWEWNDLNGTADSSRGMRGGPWGFSTDISSSGRIVRTPETAYDNAGFRLASIVPTSLSWNTTSGTWNSSTLNWSNGKGGNYALATSSTATFSNAAGGTVTISGTVRPSGITVSASSGTYALAASSGNTITGTAALLKQGAGTLTLSGSHGYTGPTTVQAGTLALNGTIASSAVTVASGATLKGNAFIGSSLTVSGTLSPGNSPGTVTTGSLSLQPGSTTLMEIVGGTSAGTDYDTIVVTGSSGPAYGGALSIVFSSGSTFANGTSFDLFRFTGATSGTFTSIATGGSGGYAGLSFTRNADGSWYTPDTAGHQYLRFSPLTGDLVIVPEPSTWVALLAGLATATAIAARRRKG